MKHNFRMKLSLTKLCKHNNLQLIQFLIILSARHRPLYNQIKKQALKMLYRLVKFKLNLQQQQKQKLRKKKLFKKTQNRKSLRQILMELNIF